MTPVWTTPMRLPADVIVQLMEVVDRCLDTLVGLSIYSNSMLGSGDRPHICIHPAPAHVHQSELIRADFYSSRQIDESISISNFFPPNRGFDFYCRFLPAGSRSRFLLPISSPAKSRSRFLLPISSRSPDGRLTMDDGRVLVVLSRDEY